MEWQLPLEDAHFKDPNTYQHKHYSTAVKHVKQRTVAVDVGAHIGIHTVRLAQDFERVYAIEPINYKYLTKNVEHLDNVRLIHAGVSNTRGTLYAHNPRPSNSGAWELDNNPSDKEINTITIDSLNLTQVDLIKVDTQGLELEVILGAKQTIDKYKPVLWIEHAHTQHKLTQYLNTINYKLSATYNKDRVYVHEQ